MSGVINQGDLLLKTDGLQKILAQVHPHYLKDDYTHFVVVTQSCDLVRRTGAHCKARYLTLAAVRPLHTVLQREIEKHQSAEFMKIASICGQKGRTKVKEFLGSLLNNNAPDYFFFHEEASFGLTESHCAFLRLSIALRATEHYGTCLGARILSLEDVFQAKLGWLIGNLYSRVGTEDWTPDHLTQSEFNQKLELILGGACKWVDDELLAHAEKRLTEGIVAQGANAIRAHVDGVKKPSKRDQVIARVVAVLFDMKLITDLKDGDRIATRLKNDMQFQIATK